MNKSINKLFKIIEDYEVIIKYGLLLLCGILIILDAKTYINYITIQESIINVKQEEALLEKEIAYNDNYLNPYLSSDYAIYFLSHTNNILFDGEYIIRFEEATEIDEDLKNIEKDKIIDNTQDARKNFLNKKLQKI